MSRAIVLGVSPAGVFANRGDAKVRLQATRRVDATTVEGVDGPPGCKAEALEKSGRVGARRCMEQGKVGVASRDPPVSESAAVAD